MNRRARILVSVTFSTVLVDQISKAWAWRHLPHALINVGSDGMVPWLNGLESSAISGAALDCAWSLVLAVLAWWTITKAHGLWVWVGALTFAGWLSSGALDRLGMHSITAPGSARGAVDWWRIAGDTYNVADMVIMAGTVTAVVAVAVWLIRNWSGPRRIIAFACMAVIVALSIIGTSTTTLAVNSPKGAKIASKAASIKNYPTVVISTETRCSTSSAFQLISVTSNKATSVTFVYGWGIIRVYDIPANRAQEFSTVLNNGQAASMQFDPSTSVFGKTVWYTCDQPGVS